MPIEGIAIVSVPVSDQESAKRFYVAKLGFDLLQDNPMGPEQRWVEVRPHGASSGASITLVTWFQSMPPGSCQGLVFKTRDIDSTFRELEARRVDFRLGIEEAPWGRYAVFEDPDGNGLVLMQEPASR